MDAFTLEHLFAVLFATNDDLNVSTRLEELSTFECVLHF